MAINIRNINASAEGNPLFQPDTISIQNLVNQVKLERNSTYAVTPDSMSYADILLLEPEIGRIVFDTTNEVERFYNGFVWLSLSATATSVGQRANTYSELTAGVNVGDLGYVNQSEGTQWLPSTLGGTYYPAGWYLWDGSLWVSDRNNIVNQLQLNVDGLGGKSDLGHTHVKAEITDFNESDYAVFAQGVLADTSLQPNDNISELVNDSGYLVGNTVTGYLSDPLPEKLFTGYNLNSTPYIKKIENDLVTFAQGVTNLTTDWANRETLTYL